MSRYSYPTYEKSMSIYMGDNDHETVLKCKVTLECDAGEKGSWDCPPCEPSAEINKIEVGDLDITDLFDLDSDAMEALKAEILGDMDAERKAMEESKAEERYENQRLAA